MVDVKVQTMYRENEVQTYPWSPPYVQVSKELPEVLLLNNLEWGRGLPAGQYEVEAITRARKKRAWDVYLASVQKTKSVDFKRKIISQIESDEWEFIGRDLEKISDTRMELARQVLEEQRIDFDSKLSKKIEMLNQRILQRYEERMKDIQFERDKEIRRIDNIVKKKFIDKYENRNIIDEYKDRMSDLYAFKTRLGYQRKNTSIVLCEDAYNKVNSVEVKHRKFSPPSRSAKMKKHNCLRERFIDTEETEFDNYFKKLDLKFGYELQDNEKKVEFEQDEDLLPSKSVLSDEKTASSERDEHLEEEISEEDAKELERKRQLFMQSFKQECLEKQERDTFKMGINDLENSLLARLLDLTSKEKQRLEEEKKILTMALIAQAERWKREARNDGIRQKQKMREAIRVRVLDEAFERISQDLEEEFQDVLRDSLMDTAIIEVEEDMRTRIYNIDRDEVPKSDGGRSQEEMVARLKEHVCPKLNLATEEKEKSLSDLGEVNEVVQDLYQDIISMALELDDLVVNLSQSDKKGSDINNIQLKLKSLLGKEIMQPALECVKNQVEQIHSEYRLHQEINDDIKQMDKLCDAVIGIADDLYQTVAGEANAKTLQDKLDFYKDDVVNEDLIDYLDQESTLYIFKLMKMSHILGEADRQQVFTSSYQIMKRARKFCKNVSKVALKIHCFLFENEYNELSEEKLPKDSDVVSEGTSNQEKLDSLRMERLCKKLMERLTAKSKTEELPRAARDKPEKIDLCVIKEEAAYVIESIVDVWLQMDALVDQLLSEELTQELQTEVMEKLKCVIGKLEERFGSINQFLGMRELQYLAEPSKCDKDAENLLSALRNITTAEVENIVETILSAAETVSKSPHGLSQLLRKINLMQQPLRSDLNSMVQDAEDFVTILKLKE